MSELGYKKSSFLDDFDIPVITHEAIKEQLVKLGRTHVVKNRQSMDSMPLEDRLKLIETEVFKVLGRYKGFVKVIYNYEDLVAYADKAIDVGFISFDTETNNSLDPLTCKIMGLCLYIPNTKPVYVPINHCKPGTEELLSNQITEEQAREFLATLKEKGTKFIYHNGKFDIRVCYNTLGIRLPIYWDTMIGAQLLNENELARLKYQYKVHVDPTISTYNIENLFTGLPYAWIDPEIFALYAAIDAYDTYKLYLYQLDIFTKPDMEKLFSLFNNIEVPIVLVTSEMEDNGICLDVDFVKKLNTKYEKGLAKSLENLDNILKPYSSSIRYYQQLGKLDNPINYESPSQLQIVLYDILKVKVLEGGKSTDKATLKALKIPFTEELLNYRHFSILIKTFTKPLPEWISKRDGKLHANFNQMGAEENNVRTGRFSSTRPNLQQMPSNEKVMRMMFSASPGYAIVGADYSAQEPRIMTHMCQDQTFLDVFREDRDPYATISSLVFKKTYWECMEHWEDGSPNEDGKKLRKKAKGIMLGILYGMGPKLMSTILGVTLEECIDILDEFFKMFPNIKEFTVNNEKMAKELGYVEDYLGRRRHLPDASLPEVEIRAKKSVFTNADLFIDANIQDSKIDIDDLEANAEWFDRYMAEYSGKGYKTKVKFKELAKEAGIDIFDNGAFISKTMTQCTNARIQGGAASLTKKAMVNIYNSKELNDLGFRLLIPVHDELLGECPIENVKEVEKLLADTMIAAAKPECSTTMKTDTYAVKRWYADEVSNHIHDLYTKLLSNGMSRESAIDCICDEHEEFSREVVTEMCDNNYNVLDGRI